MSISSINCTCLGFVVFVAVALENICGVYGRLNHGSGGSWTGLKLVCGGGGGGCVTVGMKLLNDGGCGGGGMKLLNDGGCGGGDKSLLLFLLKVRLSFFYASNLFCMSLSTAGRGAFPTWLLVTSFFSNVKLP